MKKLLALTILSTVCLAEPCFGVGFIRDRIYTSFSTNSVAIGYHYTDSIKISIEPMIFFTNVINYNMSSYALNQLQQQKQFLQGQGQQLQVKEEQLRQHVSDLSSKDMLGVFVNLHYHYKFIKTDVTPYISAGIGTNANGKVGYYFSYKISSGVNLPLSSRTNVFAGYRLLKASEGHNHGVEFGMSFNL